MSRTYKTYLRDILEAIQNIEDFSKDIDFEQFQQDKLRLHAVLHNLQIIGEATKHIPQNLRDSHPDMDWRRIAGVRDIIAHEYFGLKLDTIWSIVQDRLPELRALVSTILESMDTEE
jgi:uncharacterized protein with HEPN domain